MVNRPTLPTAIARIRAFCQHCEELDKKAWAAPWHQDSEDNENVLDPRGTDIVRCYGVWGDTARSNGIRNARANAELIALYRNGTPGMARLVLALAEYVDRDAHDAGCELLTSWIVKQPCNCSHARGVAALIAFAETLPEVPQ